MRGTLIALDALLFAGMMTDDEHLAASTAYRWLRHAEHVLQLEAGLQTQIAPDGATARAGIERELGGKGDLETSAGGVIDIEFAAQDLQLVHGHAHSTLRTTGTAPALRAAAKLGSSPPSSPSGSNRVIGSCALSSPHAGGARPARTSASGC